MIFVENRSFVIVHAGANRAANRIGEAVIRIDCDRGVASFQCIGKIVLSLQHKCQHSPSRSVTRVEIEGLPTICLRTCNVSFQKPNVGSFLVRIGVSFCQIYRCREISDGAVEICFCFAGKCAPKQRFSSFRINFDRAVVILDRGVKLAEAHSKRAACDISFEALRIVFDCVAKILQRSIDIAARKAFVSAIGEFVWRRQIVRGVNCGDANGEN
jgi:hypothetical protein